MERLRARETFKEKQQIALRIKWSKNFGLQKPPASVEVSTDFMGKDLAQSLAAMIDQDPKNLKMISSGRVVTNDELLSSQKIKPGSVVMVAKIKKDDGALKVLDEQRDILQKTKDDAAILGGPSDSGEGLEILSKFFATNVR